VFEQSASSGVEVPPNLFRRGELPSRSAPFVVLVPSNLCLGPGFVGLVMESSETVENEVSLPRRN
jgi:hypothetical protein